MATPPERTTPDSASAGATQPDLAARVDALEHMLQHLVLVLECEPRFTADALVRWIELAMDRMQVTGSVPAATHAALTRLQRRVLA